MRNGPEIISATGVSRRVRDAERNTPSHIPRGAFRIASRTLHRGIQKQIAVQDNSQDEKALL